MSFTDILAQDYIVDHFNKAIRADHLSHAYIFTGQEGVGKALFAKEFAKALNCKNNENDSCNSCTDCNRIEMLNHPDVFWIEREEKAKFIKIENIRNLQNSVRLSPLESDYKIFIIKEADKMNEEASNSLLKTLEEPSPNTIIILIANTMTPIKDTIRSRCQIIRFQPIPSHIIENQLTSKSGADANKIEWISRFCNGSMANALHLLDDNHYETNNFIVTNMTKPDMDNLAFAEEIIDSYLSAGDSLEEKRQLLKNILHCILQLYRDLLLVKVMYGQDVKQEKISLFNAGREDSLQKYANYLTQEQIAYVIDEILESIKYIDLNLNINLLVENIITRIAVVNSKARKYGT